MKCVLRVSNQNGISRLYIIVEIYHSGWKPSIYGCLNCHKFYGLTQREREREKFIFLAEETVG